MAQDVGGYEARQWLRERGVQVPDEQWPYRPSRQRHQVTQWYFDEAVRYQFRLRRRSGCVGSDHHRACCRPCGALVLCGAGYLLCRRRYG